MSEFLDMQERVDRLDHIIANARLCENFGLLKTFQLAELAHNRLIVALNYYLYVNLSQWYKNKQFSFSVNMLENYAEDIMNLPNITPNGLILPKVENCLAYNYLHSEFVHAFGEIGLNEEIESIQFPINIRIKSGRSDPTVDARPLSSTKPHADIWAGDSARAMLVFLSLLGDPESASIDFLYTPTFPKKFASPLKDYESGKEVASLAKKLPAKFCNGKWFMIDSYLLHQTVKKKEGLRISIDIRFIPKKTISSDISGSMDRMQFFTSFDNWAKIGLSSLVTTNELMGNKPKAQYDFRIVDY